MSFKFVYFLLLFSLILTSCTNDTIGVPSDTSTNPSSGVCFQNDVLPIMINNCANSGCHNTQSRVHGLDYTTYSGILKSVKSGNASSSKLIKVIQSGEMPPRGRPAVASADLSILRAWISEGAKNTQDCSSLDCASIGNVSFGTTIFPIVKRQCSGCHTARSAGGGYSFDTYSEIMRSVNNRSFVGSIKHQSGFVPMPYNAGKITDCEISYIDTWIAEGAQNN